VRGPQGGHGSHPFGDQPKVTSRDLNKPESEGRPQRDLLVMNDRCSTSGLMCASFGWHKLNLHSMGLEVWRHLDLVHVTCDYRSNGREGLKRFTIGICRPRRVVHRQNRRGTPPVLPQRGMP
jgi:hypothetical protein